MRISKRSRFKKKQIVFVVYINDGLKYTSYKIEQSRYLGIVQDEGAIQGLHTVDNYRDEVNYVTDELIFGTEGQAEEYLSRYLQKRLLKIKE